MTLDRKIEFFFAPPDPEQAGNSRSTLHLLRREVQDCLIGKLVPEETVIEEAHVEPHRLFATTMVLMTGIDLLAKFYAGSDSIGGSGERFRDFSRRYIVAPGVGSAERARALYAGLRNPLLHSFNIKSEKYTMRLVLFQGGNEPVRLRASNSRDVVISIAGVYRAFIRAVGRYETDLRGSSGLQVKFDRMFDKYGQLQYFLRGPRRT